MKTKVPIFVCPNFSVTKTKVTESNSSGFKRERENISNEDIHSLHQNIKQFNADSLKGKERVNLKQDRLTELGAPPLKQQKVPFKIQMQRFRQKQKKVHESTKILKQSGIVLPNAKFNAKSNKIIKNKDKSKKNNLSLGVKTKQGVLHVKLNK
jgi:hypothetical protein